MVYRYTFAGHVPSEDIEASLVLALWGTESLFGEAQVRLDAGHYFDAPRRRCVIDAGTEVGRCFNRLFLGFVNREFGPDSFHVEPVDGFPRSQVREASGMAGEPS